MRTTINLHLEALLLAKQRAEESGRSLGEVVSEAILAACSERAAGPRRRRVDLPVSGQGGLLPGADLDSAAALEEVMEGRS